MQRVIARGGRARVEAGLPYGPHPRHRLDVYAPRGAATAGTVVFFHGGGWTSGSRGLYRFMGAALASRGFRAVIPDYRLYPDARFPDFVEDTAAALAWARRRHEGPLFLMGHSAGAQNAALVALDPAWLAPHDMAPADIAAAALLAGPLCFNPLKTASTRDIFAGAPDPDRARPVKIARLAPGPTPPMLMLHGEADKTVAASNSEGFREALAGAGGVAALKLYPGIGHVGVVACFAWPLRWRAPALDDVTTYFRQNVDV